MRGHVEEQEVLFLGGEDAFLHQVLSQTLSNISQLVVQLQRIPGLSWKETTHLLESFGEKGWVSGNLKDLYSTDSKLINIHFGWVVLMVLSINILVNKRGKSIDQLLKVFW